MNYDAIVTELPEICSLYGYNDLLGKEMAYFLREGPSTDYFVNPSVSHIG